MYSITGGVHSDTTFTHIVPGTEESYGPFATYEEAVNVWRGKMGRMIDTCEHRLFICEVIPAVTSWLPIETAPFYEKLLLGYYGPDKDWAGFFWKGYLFQWDGMQRPGATGSPGRVEPTHFMRIGAPA